MTPNPADAKIAKTTSTTPTYKAAPAPAASCSAAAAPKAVRELRIADNKPSADAKFAEAYASWAHPDVTTCVTSYNYFVSKKGSTTAFISGITTPATSTTPTAGTQIKGLTPGGVYVVKIEAVNAKGKGPASSIEFKAWAPMGVTPL